MAVSEVIDMLSFLSPVALLLGGVTGVYYFLSIDKKHKTLVLYILSMLAIDLGTRFLSIFTSNFILFPLYCLFELIFFVYFFNRFFFNRKKNIFLILGFFGGLYIISELLQYFVLDDLNIRQFQPYAKVVDNFIIILMALSFYVEKANSYKTTERDHFKMNTVILAFFTITILVFLPFNFLVNETTGLKYYFWLLNIISLILFYTYLSYSIWQNARQNKLKTKRS